jgi:hypothetical protein
MDETLISRICLIAQRAKSDGFEDVAAWMQRQLSKDIRKSRGTRRRGMRVRLARINREVVLDEARVRELADTQMESVQ